MITMLNLKLKISLIIVVIFFSGCATMFYGKSDVITFDSYPNGASVTINGTNTNMVTPCQIDVRNGGYVQKHFWGAFNPQNYVINYELNRNGEVITDSFTPKTDANILLSFATTGLIGLYVDAKTNSGIKYKTNIYKNFGIESDNNIIIARYQNSNNGVANSNTDNLNQTDNNEVPKPEVETPKEPEKISDVDKDIPVNKQNSKRFALIIGNENYKAADGLTSDVDYALHDAQTFKKYAISTLGIPESNIIYVENATRTMMRVNIKNFTDLMLTNPETKEYYIYYAGHGMPDDSLDAYLMPTDVKAEYVRDGIKLSELYKMLATFKTKRTIIFLDACFSGGGRNGDIVRARSGVKINTNQANVEGNLLIFAAASETQVSMPYTKKYHGLFSYFLFKTLQETKGKITYNELTNQVIELVNTNSVIINKSLQLPCVNANNKALLEWENWRVSE